MKASIEGNVSPTDGSLVVVVVVVKFDDVGAGEAVVGEGVTYEEDDDIRT